MQPPSRLNDAIREWAQAIGPEQIGLDADALAVAGTATFATTRTVQAILRPANLEEVQDVVRIANRFRVPIHPVCERQELGLRLAGSGGRTASSSISSRLNRIVAFDEDLAYVTIEPGVTQRQLHELP